MSWLDAEVALITGTASGIGKASVLLFAREGARVAAVDRDFPGSQGHDRRDPGGGG